MKKFLYILPILMLGVISSCKKDDSPEVEPIRVIEFAYDAEQYETTFREEGSISPSLLQWNGDSGILSIRSDSEILRRDIIDFDTITGKIAWKKHMPLGEYTFVVKAESGNISTETEVTMKNTFKTGLFVGGFEMMDVDPEEIDYSVVQNNFGLLLNEDGSVSLSSSSNPLLSGSGEWKNLDGAEILVRFLTNFSGGQYTYMRGYLSNSRTLPEYKGVYGNDVDDNQEVLNPIGIFRFEWD